jgi:hypothetical protein
MHNKPRQLELKVRGHLDRLALLGNLRPWKEGGANLLRDTAGFASLLNKSSVRTLLCFFY